MLDVSNVTFGGSGNQESYIDMPSLVVSAGSDATYPVSEIGFGIVYQTDGSDTSSYFANLTTSSHNVVFNTNFQGMGLPTEMYAEYTEHINNLTDNVVCVPQSDGECVLSTPCSDNTDLLNYSFQIMFTSNSSYYVRVPLATFAISTDDNRCRIAVSMLSSQNVESNNVILGGMFFQEFFGVFMNQYDTTGVLESQSA